MLSSAWQSLTGRKHSREEEKKEADEHKSYDMQPLPPPQPAPAPTAPTAPTSSAPYNLRATQARKKSKNEQQLRAAIPTATIPVTPSSSSTLSYVAPPLLSPDAASLPHPEQPPPSYEASLAHSPFVASPQQQPVVFIDGHPEKRDVASEQKWPQSDEHNEHKLASQPPSSIHISASLSLQQQQQQPLARSPLPVAVPLMADQPAPFTQRLADSATAAFLALQGHPAYKAGHAKAVALAGKHVPPEVVDFIQAPSLGKLLRHPTYILIVYRLYASVRAPFVGLFRSILVNAAKRALWRRKMNEKELKANADTTNAAINDGLKQAIGKDMNVQLSPEVCRQIVENIDMKQLQQIFGWFATEPVVEAK